MFLIPEILWSPVVNFYYELSPTSVSGNTHPLINNFLQKSDNLDYLKFVIFIQLGGLIIFIVSLVKNKTNLKSVVYWILFVLALLIFIFVAFALYFAMTFNISF